MDIPGFSRSSCFSYCALKAYTVVRGLTRGLATLPLPYPMRILHTPYENGVYENGFHLAPGLLSKTWYMDGGTCSILVFDQSILRPKTAASSCIIVIAITSTSSISASSATSSAKSRSVNTSFSKVTPAIARCAVRPCRVDIRRSL